MVLIRTTHVAQDSKIPAKWQWQFDAEIRLDEVGQRLDLASSCVAVGRLRKEWPVAQRDLRAAICWYGHGWSMGGPRYIEKYMCNDGLSGYSMRFGGFVV